MMQELPNFYPKNYASEHDPKIPYRPGEAGQTVSEAPYQHVFPKYTTTYYAPPGYEEKKYNEDEKYKDEENKYKLVKY